MRFNGFIIGYSVALYGVNPDTQPARIECKKCGTVSYREQGYMRNECEKITCKKCGHTATRSDTKRNIPIADWGELDGHPRSVRKHNLGRGDGK